MASPAMPPNGAGGPPQQGGQAAVGAGQNSDPRAVIGEFRQLAQTVQQLAQKYPEFTQVAAQFLPQLQKVMSQVVGNPNRVPQPQAPPQGA